MSIINGVGRVGIRNYVAPTATAYPSSLKLFIDAGNSLSYPGTGTTVTDLIGTQNGTLINGTSYSSANGGTFILDGINDYINIGNNLLQYDEFSTSIWLKPNGTTGWRCAIQNFFYNNVGYFGWQLFIIPTTNQILIGMNDGTHSDGYRLTSTSNLSISTWYHICFTKLSNGNLKLYINGVLDSTKVMINNTVYNSLCNIRLGTQNDLGYPFPGSIPTAKIFNVVLTPTEVLADFNEFKTRYGYVSYTTRTTAFAAATGITDTTILNALNTFDTGLISNGLDTKMKALYPFVGGTANTHKFNFMDARDLDGAFRLQFNGGWVHSSTGAKGNGTNTYANTFLNALISISPSDNSFSIYKQLTETKNENYMRVGSATLGGTGGQSSIFYYSPWTSFSSSGTAEQAIVGSGKGMYVVSRNLNNLSLFKNTTKTLTTDNYKTHPNATYIIGNGNDLPQYVMNNELSFIHIGNGLSDTDASNLYTLTQALQTSLSRAV